ncbi:MAG: FAD-dependent oxidoreductase [Dehalococcoidales bacterium]|nr:FAD-dependent oxidoreductase [Dehalococcoidales bacterium]
MNPSTTPRTITEPSREINVYDEADVVVVGGGPGGHSAAVAAARNGAKTILIERYGHLGGMASGGLVILVPHMSSGGTEPDIAGLCLEWKTRLDKITGGVVGPSMDELGSSDPKVLDKWKHDFSVVAGGKVRLSWTVDPEMLKCILNDMVEEAGVKLSLHSWGTQALVENGTVKGVVFESKTGRQAILGKVIIDGTGDADLLPSAGAEFDGALDPNLRNSMLALVFRVGNIDTKEYHAWQEKDRKAAMEVMGKIKDEAGTFLMPLTGHRDDVLWVNNWIPGLSSTNADDLTTLEVSVRKMMRKGFEVMRQNLPGFQKAYILDTASQTGTRGSRRLLGEYVVTEDDMNSGKMFDDTIVAVPKINTGGVGPNAHIPYRALVPVKVEGLLIAGRSFSSDKAANDGMNLIPHCAGIGEAAGTAAAMAVKQGIPVRKVDHQELRQTLVKNGAAIPGVKA